VVEDGECSHYMKVMVRVSDRVRIRVSGRVRAWVRVRGSALII
jgi:hypothetical protein